jgi:hypothetical protein
MRFYLFDSHVLVTFCFISRTLSRCDLCWIGDLKNQRVIGKERLTAVLDENIRYFDESRNHVFFGHIHSINTSRTPGLLEWQYMNTSLGGKSISKRFSLLDAEIIEEKFLTGAKNCSTQGSFKLLHT